MSHTLFLYHRTIKSQQYHQALEDDHNSLDKWAEDWGMRFNASKCYCLPIFFISEEEILALLPCSRIPSWRK